MSIRLETRAGVADLPWTAGERVAVASLPRRLESIRLLAASVDLARGRLAFVVVGQRRKGWLALAPLSAGTAERSPERGR